MNKERLFSGRKEDRLKSFENKLVKIPLAQNKTVKTGRVYWDQGREVHIVFWEDGIWKIETIYLSIGSRKNKEEVEKELDRFLVKKEEAKDG
jgi:hypothetical protein